MGAPMNVEGFRHKLANMTNTQDSVQTMALWVTHHRSHYKQIVEVWIESLRDATKENHRLTLMYLANDVIQNTKRKGVNVFRDSFGHVLEEAASLCRDDTVRKSVLRIFNIWEERGVFDSDFCEKLQAATVSKKNVKPKVDAKFLSMFSPADVPGTIEELVQYEGEVELKRKQLSSMTVDVTSTETISRLKDRAGGKKFSEHFEDGANKLEDYVNSLKKEIEIRKKLVDLLKKSEIFYEAQFGEAKIVTNAYKNFSTRVNVLKKRLEEYKKLLPDDKAASPFPSPSVDAPSPGATPPDDPDAGNVDIEDMEVSDDDDEGGPRGSIMAVVTGTSHTKGRKQANIAQPLTAGLDQLSSFTGSFLGGGTFISSSPVPGDVANTPGSNQSAPSPEGSPADLNLSPETKSQEYTASGVDPRLPLKPEPVGSGQSYNPELPIFFHQRHNSAEISYQPSSVINQKGTNLAKNIIEAAANIPMRSFYGSAELGLFENELENSSKDSPVPDQAMPIPSVVSGRSDETRKSGSMEDEDEQDQDASGFSEDSKFGNTPVRDEKEDSLPSEAEHAPPLFHEATTNPIQFLSRIINSSKNASKDISPSQSFLSSLSMLTRTVQRTVEKGSSNMGGFGIEGNHQNFQHEEDSSADQSSDNADTKPKEKVKDQPFGLGSFLANLQTPQDDTTGVIDGEHRRHQSSEKKTTEKRKRTNSKVVDDFHGGKFDFATAMKRKGEVTHSNLTGENEIAAEAQDDDLSPPVPSESEGNAPQKPPLPTSPVPSNSPLVSPKVSMQGGSPPTPSSSGSLIFPSPTSLSASLTNINSLLAATVPPPPSDVLSPSTGVLPQALGDHPPMPPTSAHPVPGLPPPPPGPPPPNARRGPLKSTSSDKSIDVDQDEEDKSEDSGSHIAAPSSQHASPPSTAVSEFYSKTHQEYHPTGDKNSNIVQSSDSINTLVVAHGGYESLDSNIAYSNTTIPIIPQTQEIPSVGATDNNYYGYESYIEEPSYQSDIQKADALAYPPVTQSQDSYPLPGSGYVYHDGTTLNTTAPQQHADYDPTVASQQVDYNANSDPSVAYEYGHTSEGAALYGYVPNAQQQEHDVLNLNVAPQQYNHAVQDPNIVTQQYDSDERDPNVAAQQYDSDFRNPNAATSQFGFVPPDPSPNPVYNANDHNVTPQVVYNTGAGYAHPPPPLDPSFFNISNQTGAMNSDVAGNTYAPQQENIGYSYVHEETGLPTTVHSYQRYGDDDPHQNQYFQSEPFHQKENVNHSHQSGEVGNTSPISVLAPSSRNQSRFPFHRNNISRTHSSEETSIIPVVGALPERSSWSNRPRRYYNDNYADDRPEGFRRNRSWYGSDYQGIDRQEESRNRHGSGGRYSPRGYNSSLSANIQPKLLDTPMASMEANDDMSDAELGIWPGTT